MPTININGQRVTVGEEFLQLSPEEQDAAVDEIAAELTPPDASTSFGMNMGDALLFGQSDKIAGGLNYLMEGGAEGAYERGVEASEQRHAQADQAHPIASGLGSIASVAIPVPGVAAASSPRLAMRALESALKWGGRGMQGVTLAQVLSGNVGPKELLTFAAGRGMSKLGRAMTARRAASAPRTSKAGRPAPAPGKAPRAPRGTGSSPHERVYTLQEAMRKRGKMSPEDYMKRADTYTRRGASYRHEKNLRRDYPEIY